VTPAVPVTSKNMPRGAIIDTIATQFPTFLKSCIKHHELTGDPAFNPIIEYPVEKFREHCEPFLPIGTADLEKDCDGALNGLTGLIMHTAKRQNAEGFFLTVKATGLFLLGISERYEK
jgi:hypothetical protein